jgi:hypothetical protein
MPTMTGMRSSETGAIVIFLFSLSLIGFNRYSGAMRSIEL